MQENAALRPVYVSKADMAVSQLQSGGALLPLQEKRYFLVAIKKAVMMPLIFTMLIDRNTKEIPKMTTFGSQVWYPATELEELAQSERVRPGFDRVYLHTQEVMCQVNFPRYFLRAQVELAGFQNTLLAYLGLHSARDFDNIILNGDIDSTNSFLALQDGLIKLATSNVYPVSGGPLTLSSDILDRTVMTMPDIYADQENMSIFTTRQACQAYRRELMARIGNLGDKAILEKVGLTYDGFPVVRVPMMPGTLGGTGTETVLMHLNPKMFIFAVEQGVEIETEYYKKARMWSVIMTARIGQNYQHEPAVVKTTGVLNA